MSGMRYTEDGGVYVVPSVDVTAIYNEAFENGRAEGEETENEKFWNALTANNTRGNYSWAFAYWDKEEIRPPHKIVANSGNLVMTFVANKSLREVSGDCFDFSNTAIIDDVTKGNYCTFMMCSELEKVGDIGLPPAAYNLTFSMCTKLKTIEKLNVNESTKFSGAFGSCDALENLTVSGKIGQNGFNVAGCPLSAESIASIVNALADKRGDTSGTTWTITLGTSNKNKLTAEQKTHIANYGWTVK